MTGNKGFRTSIVRSAAAAILESFPDVNVRWAIYGDLAWHLLCRTPTSSSWRLEVQVMGDSPTLMHATEHLASVDHRFSITSQDTDGNATMTYTHNRLNRGSPTKKHKCKVRFVSGQLENVFIVKGFPLLEIQSIIYRRMESCVNKSEKNLKKCMLGVIALGEAYLRLPNLSPPVWSIAPAERPLFLRHLSKITSAFPESADLLTHLHPSLFPTSTIVSIPPSIVLASRLESAVILDGDVASLSRKGRKLMAHSETVLTATRTISSSIHQQGHDCFLAGPGYVPWYIMGSPVIPTNHDIDFLVILRNGDSLDSLQCLLCRQGVLKARKGAFLFSVPWRDGKLRSCRVSVEEVPSSLGLCPDESVGTSFNGISIINQSYLFSTLLATVNSQGLLMTKYAYKSVVAVLELLCHRNADVSAAFKDREKLDQLANDVVAVHPELTEYFSTIGFHSSLLPIPPSVLPEVDVHTACGPTPTARIPTIRREGGIVFKAAVDATRLLQNSGYSCAIFGGAACYLYGNERLPNDIDFLVSSSDDAELIKRSLVNQDPIHFYLIKSLYPEKQHQKLRYERSLHIGQQKVRRYTKVDILTPGTMMLPFLSSRSVVVKNGLPLVPVEVLLLHKLQGWHDNMTASEPHKQMKQTTDAADVRCMLKIVLQTLTGNKRSWASVALSFFEEEFQHLTIERVKEFCSGFADCRDDWHQLGFEVA
ncbi:hypothetical protein EDD18DRAFT_1185348 [Armillaria luteobubalina]|uniref:Uncharacterized protein n=1 Tax=Armillaria luteobubalina TaxID=153913 RepID=A0AA39PYE6_9AGAR|nr:hypothetical protein EDD18DRAFT_1185348 [Armillaria luteobubalina]